MKCFYHKADLDGISSAAYVNMMYPNCELIGVDYGEDYSKILGSIDIDERVWVVDFTFEPIKIMQSIAKKGDLFWFDHHLSSIEYAKELKASFQGSIGKADNKQSTIALLYDYFKIGRYSTPNLPTIEMISLFDTWQWKEHQNADLIHAFNVGAMNILSLDPEDRAKWRSLFQHPIGVEGLDLIQQCIKTGYILIEYLKQNNEQNMSHSSFNFKYKQYQFLCLNTALKGSLQFESKWNPEIHDAMIAFYYLNNKWRYSMYTDKPNVDILKIATYFGGGG
ncbi:MAG: hypothetical protein HGB12_12610, partial [Bacteroidetes bacterium]|nr:hypothetical protein [Bacteroidota bacterium]